MDAILLLTAFDSQTSMTSSWTEMVEGKILAENITHYYLDLGVTTR